MRVRWTGEGDREVMVTTDEGVTEQLTFKRLEWVRLPKDKVGKRPTGHPGDDDFDPGSGVLAQGSWDGAAFVPLWELESATKAQRTRADNEAEPEADGANENRED